MTECEKVLLEFKTQNRQLLKENKQYREILEKSYVELRQLYSSLDSTGASSNDLGVLEYVGLTLIKQTLDKGG